ncbi:NAD(P)/FAD-dependent oxidoreductase [Oceanibacterium hippocampi]|uniref:Rhodocoxin reductase n=1 Tax=Oceanibacterium hippocampi TaxID=745714 RepID=A0A1Y5TFN4_9PROT|nr:FAD-dependent oxidoreductase [Oceanibacterium hippocampi]SLN62982.1 Rhodocoxin reductase [Oceanibacterium hippocampi]
MAGIEAERGVVVVGAGQAGYQVADSLRREGFDGPVALVGEEPHLPYQRPPLSKSYMLGDLARERLSFRNEDYYGKHNIALRLGTRVTAIERSSRQVRLVDGTTLPYSHLVLATGARVRRLPVPGADLAGVFDLRSLDDSDRIKAALARAADVVVIGAGFIGLEFAAAAAKLGKRVRVLEALPRVMARVLSPELSDFFTALHRGHGVDIACGMAVNAITGESGAVSAVACADGSSHKAELVLVGIGVVPETALAEAAGLTIDNGIVVDGHGRTSDPAILAAGDCAAVEHPFTGRRIRLESVQNAADLGRTVAATIAGHDRPYVTVPWFWSDQYDVKLQMVGLQDGCDRTVLRGDPALGKFSLFHFRGTELRAIDSVNRAGDHLQGRKLLAAGVSPTPDQAADPDFPLKSLLA